MEIIASILMVILIIEKWYNNKIACVQNIGTYLKCKLLQETMYCRAQDIFLSGPRCIYKKTKMSEFSENAQGVIKNVTLKLKFEAVLKKVEVSNAREISAHLFDSAKMFAGRKVIQGFSMPVAHERM